jgi:hypothetical protein
VRRGLGFGGTLARGREGEARLAYHYGGRLTEGRAPWDLELDATALEVWEPVGMFVFDRSRPVRVEVKSDRRATSETPNMYVERRVILPSGELQEGGIWRAAAEGADAFVYVYADGLACWMFGLASLAERLDALAPASRTWRKTRVSNPDGRTAVGRLIPRADVAAIAAPWYVEDWIP